MLALVPAFALHADAGPTAFDAYDEAPAREGPYWVTMLNSTRRLASLPSAVSLVCSGFS